MDTALKIGWVGAGVMGKSMAKNLIDAGANLMVYNRTPEKCTALVELGARMATSIREIGSSSDVVFTIVGYPEDVRQIYLGEDGLLSSMNRGTLAIDMTTSEPSLAKEIHKEGSLKGISVLDAPVSGGDVGAQNGTLSIMCGGVEMDFRRALPMFEILGRNVRLIGEPGSGQHTKMCNQIVISTNMIGMVEGLIYASRNGLDIGQVLEAISSGAASSWSLTNLAPRIISRNFDPGFYVEHFVKDLEIALREASRLNLALPGLALSHQLYLALKAQGHGRKGTQALQLAIEKLNNM